MPVKIGNPASLVAVLKFHNQFLMFKARFRGEETVATHGREKNMILFAINSALGGLVVWSYQN